MGLLTWIVFPFLAVTTSPGLVAFPLGMFSHRGARPGLYTKIKYKNRSSRSEMHFKIKESRILIDSGDLLRHYFSQTMIEK